MTKLYLHLAAGLAVGLSFVAFAEDAYVEANGTQVILLDYVPKATTRYEVDFQYTQAEKQTWAAILGYDDYGVKLGLVANTNGNIESPFGTGADDWSHGMIPYDAVRHTAIIDRYANTYTMLTGGAVVGTVQKPNHEGAVQGENHRPLTLFGCANNNYLLTGNNYSKARIFGVKVFEDNDTTPVREYVPCKKGSELGFYEKTTGRFFGRLCGSKLTGDGDILEIEDDPYVSSPNGLVTVCTGYPVGPETCLEADFSFEVDTPQQYVFEAGPHSGDPIGRVYVTGRKSIKWFWSDTALARGVVSGVDGDGNEIMTVAGVRRQIKLDSYNETGAFWTYGVLHNSYMMPGTRTKTASSSGPGPLRLFSGTFGTPVGDNAKSFATMKLYGFKIYEKGVLQHDYEPMSWKGVGVLRDRVTGRILCANKNSDAANDLSYGGKIREVPYLKSTGNQKIVLDYKPNDKTHIEFGLFDVDSTPFRRIFGVYNDASIHCWVNGGSTSEGPWGNPEFKVHGAWTGRLQTNSKDNYIRAYVVNIANDTAYDYIGGYAEKTIDLKTKSGYVHAKGESSSPISVFNVNPTPGANDFPLGAAFCLTHVVVKEDGEVIHLYEPCVKDGLAGLRDAKTGAFFSGLNTGNDDPVLYGGAVASEGVTDAYIESDGTQFVPTDYYFNEKTRLEIDFQFVSGAKSVALAGSWNQNPSCSGFYRTAAGNFEFVTPNAANTEKVHTSTSISADLKRYQAFIDVPAGKSQFLDGETVLSEKSVAAFTGTATVPFGIFGNTTSSATTGGELSSLRIFSFRIWEKEGDKYVLKREYLPYKSGETVGFRDSVTGEIFVNTQADANPLKIGGLGVEGSGGVFKVVPAGQELLVGEQSTLTAFAAGAVKYRWTKDGQILDETGDKLVVAWQGKPRQSVYTVTPVFDVYGTLTDGESASATISNHPRGFFVIVR